MQVLTPEEMRRADRIAIDALGVPGIDLMRRAGSEVGRVLLDRFGSYGNRFAVLSGKGNNGGDGFGAARWLADRGALVEIFLFGRAEELAGDAAESFQAACSPRILIHELPDSTQDDRAARRIERADVVVDALLGTGFSGAPRGRIAEAIRLSRRARGVVAAIDIPSGVDGLCGLVEGEAVCADLTITLCRPKVGLYLHPGRAHAGEIVTVPIGMPEKALEGAGGRAFLFDEEAARRLVRPRARDAHKGHFGRILIAGGSPNYTGAPLLAGRAAIRTGGGLVTLGLPASLRGAYAGAVLELMTLALADEDGSHTEKGAALLLADPGRFDVLAVGPGFGRGDGPRAFLRRVLAGWGGPLVIDADGLHAIAGEKDAIASSRARIVFTPHLGELEALSGARRESILADRTGFVREWAAAFRAVLLLKGNPTLVADPEGIVSINTSGNPGMATAGSGDVLTGTIAALLGAGLSAPEAARLGVWLHGRAGDRAAERKGEAGLVAGDLIESLPDALRPLEEEAGAR
ncbi:MAG: NAD(P)H-hydrate dehydratase [Candidatus Eisenbacteria bacterium]|nr:NAD(P)H-hydrate dehydratase [Candidatus Eisenbacteria bacterium]